MSDQLVAEIATATYTTHNKRERPTSMPSAGFQARDPSVQAAVDLRLRPRGYRDQSQ
jgi:hypothetical protein